MNRHRMTDTEFRDRVTDLSNQLSWLGKQMAKVLKDIEELYEENKVTHL